MSHFYPKSQVENSKGVFKRNFRSRSFQKEFIDQNHLVFLKVYPERKQIIKDGSRSYCDEEIKERFIDIIPFLPQMAIVILEVLLCSKFWNHFLAEIILLEYPVFGFSKLRPLISWVLGLKPFKNTKILHFWAAFIDLLITEIVNFTFSSFIPKGVSTGKYISRISTPRNVKLWKSYKFTLKPQFWSFQSDLANLEDRFLLICTSY